ncbi:hypothetical protein K4L06_06075 [Lysobacter sp. BMK333-48F3]|uniref:hypothetical protein n=1 Tax=Lysobacter sp. BMK333-48F3 TaxID=2867962 RepID=UPI001C8C95DE|nr:hypothetical protein [Lysobacter sp. BMK333-48F3]MBX9400873.1 hypothetical protein [Lysobacter sp. BMK333-48F3]
MRLKMEVGIPCVSLANDDVAVLLPEAVVRRVAEGKDQLQHNDHARRVWGDRAKTILAQADEKQDRFGCRTMALSSDEATYLVAELIKRGDAAVYTSKSRELQATASFSETSCESAPSGYLDIFAGDGTPVIRMITCQV